MAKVGKRILYDDLQKVIKDQSNKCIDNSLEEEMKNDFISTKRCADEKSRLNGHICSKSNIETMRLLNIHQKYKELYEHTIDSDSSEWFEENKYIFHPDIVLSGIVNNLDYSFYIRLSTDEHAYLKYLRDHYKMGSLQSVVRYLIALHRLSNFIILKNKGMSSEYLDKKVKKWRGKRDGRNTKKN